MARGKHRRHHKHGRKRHHGKRYYDDDVVIVSERDDDPDEDYGFAERLAEIREKLAKAEAAKARRREAYRKKKEPPVSILEAAAVKSRKIRLVKE